MAIQNTVPVPVTSRRSLWAGTVTLTSANTNYHIIDLINALTSLSSVGAQVPGATREFILLAFPGVDGTGANTNDILIGDANVSATNFGVALPAGANVIFRSTYDNAQVAGLYVRSAGASQKLCITVMGG